MNAVDIGNMADEVLYRLTDALEGDSGLEVIESAYDLDDDTAWARVVLQGRVFRVLVSDDLDA